MLARSREPAPTFQPVPELHTIGYVTVMWFENVFEKREVSGPHEVPAKTTVLPLEYLPADLITELCKQSSQIHLLSEFTSEPSARSDSRSTQLLKSVLSDPSSTCLFNSVRWCSEQRGERHSLSQDGQKHSWNWLNLCNIRKKLNEYRLEYVLCHFIDAK